MEDVSPITPEDKAVKRVSIGLLSPEERYKRAHRMLMSSSDSIKQLGKEILLKEGIDITLVNLKEDGITIEAFGKLVRQIYEAGYMDGMAGWAESKDELRKKEKEGLALNKHQWFAKQIVADSQINKGLSL